MKHFYLLGLVLFIVLTGCTSQDPAEVAQDSTQEVSENNEQSQTQEQTSFITTPQLVEVYPSDPSLFTQGLEMSQEGELLLSTGQYGESRLGILNLENGEFNESYSLDDQYFGEGFTQTPNHLWHLTWQSGVAFGRNLDTYEPSGQVSYEGEGWGLAYDSDQDLLYMSDGTSIIDIRDPDTFEKVDEFEVAINERSIEELNELEYGNGYLYSNVWYENSILKIDPETAEIEQIYDMDPLLEGLDLTEEQKNRMDSLNGIAHIEGDRFYITGKYYPIIMEVILN